MKLMVEGYFRLYENRTFAESNSVNQFNTDYHEENNGTLTFISDHTVDDFFEKRGPEVYEQYETWAEENGLTVQSKKILNSTIEEVMGLKLKPSRKNGVTQRLYKLIEHESASQ